MSIHTGDSITPFTPISSSIGPKNGASNFPLELVASQKKKRARDEVDKTKLDQRPFTIRDPTEPFARPKILTPICLLSRVQLPLAYLDTAQAGSRLFSAHISVLEDGSEEESTVLLAKAEHEQRMYAIERVKSRTYALCRLQAWVSRDELMERSCCKVKVEDLPQKRRAVESSEKGLPWWAKAAINVPDDVVSDASNLPALTMRRVMEAPQSGVRDAQALNGEGLQPVATDTMDGLDLEEPRAQQPPEDALQDLAKHYMEALYIERTSLAYFTKGPLSRTRATLASHSAETTPAHLIEFLRQCVLSSNIMDKKYKEGIHEVVKDLPAPSLATPDDSTKRRKKKRKWKMKRSKAGFFVGEEDYVERWWRADDVLSSPETAADALRWKLPKLRVRETFLQVILVLEILASDVADEIDANATRAGPTPGESQYNATSQAKFQRVGDAKKTKLKKQEDLPALLDTMLDKLCIWHSLDAHSPTKTRVGEKLGVEVDANDHLQSFCIDVILPFYVSRVPQYAALVNKKLGGPSATPVKRNKSAMGRKPGAPAVRRPQEKRLRQPLARVSTDTLNRSHSKQARPPSLHRSATDIDTLLPHIKRENSESPSLASVPLAQALGKDRRTRPNPLEQISSRQRVIDLSAMSQASEAKLRKKAERAEMIKEAVEGIKKPNRALAVKEGAERADETFAKAVGGVRGVKVPQKGRKMEAKQERSSAGDGSRPQDMVAATPARIMDGAPAAQHPASSISMVPSSSARLRAPPIDFQPPPTSDPAVESSFVIPHTGHRPRRLDMNVARSGSTAVHETPSRGFAKFMPRGLASQPGAGILESPVMRRTAPAVQATPLKAQAMLNFHGAIDATPVPRRQEAGQMTVGDTYVRPVLGGTRETASSDMVGESRRDEPREETSIYATLGWDDDGDYEVLA